MRCKILYQRVYVSLLVKYGLEEAPEEAGSAEPEDHAGAWLAG